MSYASAVLFRIDSQANVTEKSFLKFVEFLREEGLLPFPGEVGEASSQIDYFYYDEDTDDEHQALEEIASLEGIANFIKGKRLDFCSIAVVGGATPLEAEVCSILQSLNRSENSDVTPASMLSYGFGNVLDAVAGQYVGWSFFIETSACVSDFTSLKDAFDKSRLTKGQPLHSICTSLEKIFKSNVSIEGCRIGLEVENLVTGQ